MGDGGQFYLCLGWLGRLLFLSCKGGARWVGPILLLIGVGLGPAVDAVGMAVGGATLTVPNNDYISKSLL